MKRPKTVEQYVELVKQALFEVEDMRAAIEYDMEGMGQIPEFIEQLEAQVGHLREQMVAGTYQFATGDLAFMGLVKAKDETQLPCRQLLILINETHLHGLDVDPD